MRSLLPALCLVCLTTLVQPPLSAQMVEKSLAQDPGPLDFIQGDSYEQWILQSLAGDTLVGIAADGSLVLERVLGVPGLGTDWMARMVVRDRAGLALRIHALALLWALSQP